MGRKFTIFSLLYFVFEGKFQVQAPPGGLYSEGRFNRGFWGLRFWGAYIYLEGLIHGGAFFRNFTVFPSKGGGGDYSREAINRGTAIIRGNAPYVVNRFKLTSEINQYHRY